MALYVRQFEKLHISITADNKITQTSAAFLQMSVACTNCWLHAPCLAQITE